ncbi:MAG: alginate export family protein [Gammaproteobacteria bacterium]
MTSSKRPLRRPTLSALLLCLSMHAAVARDETGPAGALTGESISSAPTGFFPVEQDDIRPADQLTLDVFGRPLVIGGELEFAPDWEINPELDNDEEDEVMTGEESLALEFLYRLSPRWALFLKTEVFSEDTWDVDNDRDRESQFGMSREQHWLFVQHLFDTPFSVQIGRQNVTEKREWWWDQDLDGIRVHYEVANLHAELMLAEEVGAIDTAEGFDPQERDVRRWLGQLKWQWAERHRLELFFLDQADHSRHEPVGRVIDRDDEDPIDGDLRWWGLRQSGSFKIPHTGRFYYWLDTAAVEGDSVSYDYEDVGRDRSRVDAARAQSVSGWAFDAGLIWRTKLPRKPTLTISLAAGSGDGSPDSGDSHAFIPTGLNGNNGKYRGVNRFRYYGEFLRPELSNLAVGTLAVGRPILENSSVELIYHRYRQLHAADRLFDAKVDTDPSGRSADIGDALDLAIGVEESAHFEFEFILGAFRAGRAFEREEGKVAGTVQFKVNFNF